MKWRWTLSGSVMLWVFAGAGVAGLLVLVGWAIWRVPQALYAYVPDLKDRANVEASTRTGMIAGLAGLAALGSLVLTNRTYRLTQQGQLADRYTKAIAQLGDDKLDVRLGGIYALERIAVDSKRDHPTVVEVLSAYVRERSTPIELVRPTRRRTAHPPTLRKQVKLRSVDVQAALTVLGRLPRRAGVSRGDLSQTNISGANLLRADLTGAKLFGSNLSGASLHGAHLSGATLSHTDLATADLSSAFLWRADLNSAHLAGANLTMAVLPEADLNSACFAHANLSAAILKGANLASADLSEANLTRADLSEAYLTEADLSEANLTEARA